MTAVAGVCQAPTVAVVGSGPAGCYAAQFLRREWADAEIVVFDALPVPYGLVRHGIAPDHQGNKAVTRQFDRVFERQGVHFLGGVEVGRDIGYVELADAFDVVVLATGMEADRPLGVPAHAAARVVGAGALMRALNGDPSVETGTVRAVGPTVAVVGHGNVGLDVVRMLTAPREHFVGSDVDDAVLAALRATPVRRVELIGRSPVARAKFDSAGVREVCRLPGVAVTTVGLDPDDPGEVAAGLRAAERARPRGGRVEIRFWFDAPPTRVTAHGGSTIVHVATPSGPVAVAVDTLVTATGFVHRADRPTQAGIDGRTHVFRTGWCRRGATGGVAANRKCAQEVVGAIAEAVRSGEVTSGRPGLAAIRSRLGPRVVGFEDWRRIDRHEIASAAQDRCRTKITDLAGLHAVAAPGGTAPVQPGAQARKAAP